MFRIKPTRNQTTAKHANLSPYPNNQLLLERKVQTKLPNKIALNDYKKEEKKIGTPLVSNTNNPKIVSNLNVQARITGKIGLNNPIINHTNQINNPQKVTKQPLTNPTKNVSLVSNNTPSIPKKQHERILLKRSENHKEHKLKLNDGKKIETSKIGSTNTQKGIAVIKKEQVFNPEIKKKQSVIQNYQKPEIKIEEIPQKSGKNVIEEKSSQLKISQKLIDKHKKVEQKSVIISPVSNQPKQKVLQQKIQSTISQNQIPEKKPEISHFNNLSPIEKPNSKIQQPNQTQQQPQNEQKDEKQKEKEKQMQNLMLKIQKRRQAREQQKRRLKEIEQKRKQNEQRAMEFLNSRNNRDNPNFQVDGQNAGVTGMLKLNDQLMHFSLAQTIMDLQIKKLLKTNLDQFPNSSQIKYQLQELERINMSYEMIRDDPHNPLKNGLQNYRVQIFNKIGDLIMQAQQNGFTNPNFHILEHDGRLNNGPNSVIPKAMRGLPQESHHKFIKYEKNYQEDECTICLGEIKIGQVCANVECGHKFHQTCIKEWVLTSANCPTCRFNIKFGHKD